MVLGALIVVIITIFLPPLGVLLVAGCGADFFVNCILTLFGFLPGHVHAFYLEYVFYTRREDARVGRRVGARAPLIFSDRVQTGGY